MAATAFNPIQIHLLKIFKHKKSEEDPLEMQDVFGKYYSQKKKPRLCRVAI